MQRAPADDQKRGTDQVTLDQFMAAAEAEIRVAEIRMSSLVPTAPLRLKVQAAQRLREADAALAAVRELVAE